MHLGHSLYQRVNCNRSHNPVARALVLPALLVGLAFAILGCGGGSGAPAPSPTAIDSDPAASPAADASYYGVPRTSLGALVSGSNVTFAYWNPTAASVTVNLYANWNDPLGSPAATLAMTKGPGGVWSTATVPLPAQAFYVYNVGGAYLLDPYARSMAKWVHANGAAIPGDTVGKGAILDPAASALDPDGGWSLAAGSAYFDGSRMKAADGTTAAPYTYASNRDAIIYEAGVRDLTVDPTLRFTASGHPWGTFKALTDMLPHIQKLGVTHVQLLCPLQNFTYDQTKIGTRELTLGQTTGANYNWGYDPQNYFTPTGMYSANPDNPGARIQEMRTLINEIHKQGMGVILDVVYNHTANNNVLGASLLPGYLYRSSANNGAGSNDVKSESKMVRKLIVDSIVQWVRDYKADGFRFDLMGVLDTETIQAAYQAAHDLNPRTIFLGEGWKGFYTGPGTDYNGKAIAGADQGNAAVFLGKNVGMFSDSYRDILKRGGLSEGPAFLTGTAQNGANLFANVAGVPTNGFAPGSTDNVVNYLTCHDNLCLYDALAFAANAPTGATGDADILKRAKVGYAVLLTSQGTAFLHAGDEMFRTKETTTASTVTATASNGRIFVHNSYNASDAINLVKWATVYSGDPITGGFANYDTTQNGYKLYRYTQGLIALRKATDAFRLPDAHRAANVTSLPATGAGSSTLAFGYKAVSSNGTGTYYVFHNADTVAHTFAVNVNLNAAQLLADGASAGLTAIGSPTGVSLSADGLTVTVAPLTSAIFKN